MLTITTATTTISTYPVVWHDISVKLVYCCQEDDAGNLVLTIYKLYYLQTALRYNRSQVTSSHGAKFVEINYLEEK